MDFYSVDTLKITFKDRIFGKTISWGQEDTTKKYKSDRVNFIDQNGNKISEGVKSWEFAQYLFLQYESLNGEIYLDLVEQNILIAESRLNYEMKLQKTLARSSEDWFMNLRYLNVENGSVSEDSVEGELCGRYNYIKSSIFKDKK